ATTTLVAAAQPRAIFAAAQRGRRLPANGKRFRMRAKRGGAFERGAPGGEKNRRKGGKNPDGRREGAGERKIYLRLLPFAVIAYLLCYIDRINVSFAALTMRGDLGMSAQAFGFAAGTFYWGYFIAEVPSNIVLKKVGARLWIARIMITWGLL